MHAINFVLANTVINLSISEEESKSTVYVFYKAKYFQAFHYYYKLARNCRRRIEKIIKSSDVEDVMHEDLYIRIGIVGKLIDADYKLISEGRGNINSIIHVECECVFILLNIFSLKFDINIIQQRKKNCQKMDIFGLHLLYFAFKMIYHHQRHYRYVDNLTRKRIENLL